MELPGANPLKDAHAALDQQPGDERMHPDLSSQFIHTRRALSIFRARLPQYQWSVAASSWPANAAEHWWKHRWWAKTVIDEWEKYLWWELVDRWRSGLVLN